MRWLDRARTWRRPAALVTGGVLAGLIGLGAIIGQRSQGPQPSCPQDADEERLTVRIEAPEVDTQIVGPTAVAGSLSQASPRGYRVELLSGGKVLDRTSLDGNGAWELEVDATELSGELATLRVQACAFDPATGEGVAPVGEDELRVLVLAEPVSTRTVRPAIGVLVAVVAIVTLVLAVAFGGDAASYRRWRP